MLKLTKVSSTLSNRRFSVQLFLDIPFGTKPTNWKDRFEEFMDGIDLGEVIIRRFDETINLDYIIIIQVDCQFDDLTITTKEVESWIAEYIKMFQGGILKIVYCVDNTPN